MNFGADFNNSFSNLPFFFVSSVLRNRTFLEGCRPRMN